jgi:hypothetical protein
MLQTFQSAAMPYGGPSGHFWYHMNANTLRYRIDGANEDFGGYQFQNLQRFLHSGNRGLSAGNLKLAIDGIDNATSNASTQTFDLSTMYAGNGGGFPYSGYIQEFLMYDSSKSASDQNSIESNIGDYFTQNTPLLDTYTGAAAAYSLRKLRSAYSGSAIRVRRASDNTEQDIGFNVFGELDTVSLASFCSGTDGFVKTWYDQSGNANDATQTTTANQPKIYDSVTGVVTENGKPAFEFTGGTGQRLDIGGYGSTAPWTILQVMGRTASAGQGEYIGTLKANDNYFYNLAVSGSTIRLESRANGACNSSYVTETNNLLAYHKIDGSSSEIALNGAAVATGTQNPNLSAVVIGKGGAVMQTGDVFFQEYILYQSDQSSNRTNIESNINTFYNIYS